MIPYLITYLISFIFAYIASVLNDKILKFIFCILSITPLVLFAALRDITIGGDTAGYPYFLYKISYYMQYIDMLSQFSDSYDFLFVLGTAYVTKTFRNFNVVLGSYHLFMCAIFICYMYKEHPKSIWVGVLTFNAFIFQGSLTIIRQMLAYSVLLVSFFLAKHKRPFLFLGSIFVAYCFHRTAILGLIIYPFFMMFRTTNITKQERKMNTYLTFTAILFAFALFIIAFIFKEELVRFLALTKESYSYQVDRLNSGKLTYSTLFLLAFNVFVYIMFADKKTVKIKSSGIIDPSLTVSFVLAITYFFLCLFSLAAYTLQRIGSGFIIFFPLFCCLIADHPVSPKHKRTFLLLLISFSIVYTIFSLTNWASYQTVPYTSQILTEWLGIQV